MSFLAECKSLFASAIGRKRMEQEMDAELKFHIASYAEDLVRSGMPRKEAERMAGMEFGAPGCIKEECRQALGLRLLDETIQDLSYAKRTLVKNPGFALLAVLTLAVGIGLNTATFSIVNGWVLKPLPYPNPERLVAIWAADRKRGGPVAVTAADLYEWRQQNPVFEEMCGWTMPLLTLTRDNEPRQLNGIRVNAEFFRMMGVTPQLGRTFLTQEDQPGATPVAVLSDGLWRDTFAADPDLVGKPIQIDGQKTIVVGVLPPGFHLPLMGRAGIWMPLALSEAERADRNLRFLSVMGRTKPGVGPVQAAQYLKTVATRLEKTYPASNAGRTVTVTSLQDEIGRKTGREPTLFCFGLVGCVLLLACANVANLVMGRGLQRQREMAVRLAIGAGRFRLLRQLLTENLLLFALSAILSIAFAVWGTRWIQNSLSYEIRGNLPNTGELHVDMAVLLYTFGIALVTGLMFGFAPALQCWRVDVNHGLSGANARVAGSAGSARLKNFLVIFEMALALIVVVASGLMVKGMSRMDTSDPGFDPRGLLSARVVLSDSKYSDPTRVRSFFDDVLQRIAPLPGLKAVAAAQFIPYEGNYRSMLYAIDGMPIPAPADRPIAISGVVTPEYFAVIGIPLLRGRVFSKQDRVESSAVGVVNQTMARRHWPHQDPIGQRVRFGPLLSKTFTIVGVVQDTLGQTETDIPRPQIYFSAQQFPTRSMAFLLRADANSPKGASALAGAIRRAAKAVDPGQAIFNVRTIEELRYELFSPARLAGHMMALFGAFSLLLAASGIYSVLAYSVAARRKEFGIRMALGARRGDLVSMVTAQGMRLAVIGFAIGLAGSLATTRFMSSILYHVSPTDLPTFLLTGLLMLLVAAIGCYLPGAPGIERRPREGLAAGLTAMRMALLLLTISVSAQPAENDNC